MMISFEKTSASISMAKYLFTRKFKSFDKNLHVVLGDKVLSKIVDSWESDRMGT